MSPVSLGYFYFQLVQEDQMSIWWDLPGLEQTSTGRRVLRGLRVSSDTSVCVKCIRVEEVSVKDESQDGGRQISVSTGYRGEERRRTRTRNETRRETDLPRS